MQTKNATILFNIIDVSAVPSILYAKHGTSRKDSIKRTAQMFQNVLATMDEQLEIALP